MSGVTGGYSPGSGAPACPPAPVNPSTLPVWKLEAEEVEGEDIEIGMDKFHELEADAQAILADPAKKTIVDALMLSLPPESVATNPAVNVDIATLLSYKEYVEEKNRIDTLPTKLSLDEKQKIQELAMLKGCTAEEIASIIGKSSAEVRDHISVFKNSKKEPNELAELEKEKTTTEWPTYILPCWKAELKAIPDAHKPLVDWKLQQVHHCPQSDVIFKGQCCCAHQMQRVYNFMVLGQTGAGKTTFIDSYINFLTGVEFYDKFRYKLIDERKIHAEIRSARSKAWQKGGSTQTQSLTSSVTIYHIPSAWIKKGLFRDEGQYCINIIDTPGFGDTRGLEQDQVIFKMIAETLKTLISIDYILVVTPHNVNRLTAAAEHIFSTIQSLFAVDVMDRFMSMFTFSDGKLPLAVHAVQEAGLRIDKYLKFNNSAIWESTDDRSTLNFFNLGYSSYQEFGKFIAGENKPCVSTHLSAEVINKRIALEDLSFQTALNCQALTKNIATIQDEIRTISTNTDKINKNKNWKLKKSRMGWQEKDYIVNGVLKDVTKCTKCAGLSHKGNGMCHLGCVVGANKQHCCVMSSAGFCTKCGCPWGDHINTTKHYVQMEETHFVDNETMKSHFDQAHGELDTATKYMIFAIDEQLQKLGAFEKAQQTIQLCDKFLQEHAVRKKPFNSIANLEEQIKVLTERNTRQDQAQLSRLKQMLGRQKTLKQTYEGKIKVMDEHQGDEIEVTIDKAYFSELKFKLEDQKKELLKPKEKREEGFWTRIGKSLDNIFGSDDAGN